MHPLRVKIINLLHNLVQYLPENKTQDLSIQYGADEQNWRPIFSFYFALFYLSIGDEQKMRLSSTFK